MIRGELFELECLEYLQNKYNYENVHFNHNGGMDSTMSDISVIKNGKIAFFIEVKDNTAQSGQFVVSSSCRTDHSRLEPLRQL